MSVNLLVVVSFLFSFTAISPARAVTNNVTAYGAIPNDGLGDADAIQAAINAANSGDTVFLPEGTFNLDKSIQLVGGVYLAGSGDGVSQTKLSGPAGLGHDLQKQIQAYDFAGIEDIRFENIEIEVEGSAIASQSNRFIQDCTFLITDWDVIRTIYLNGEDVTDYSNRVKNVTIENCFFDHTRMAIEGGLEDGIIRNNVFEGCLNGLKLYHLSNVTIAENSITAGDAPNLGDEVRCGIKIMSEKSFTPIFRGVQIISN
jgi:polygalacturonase